MKKIFVVVLALFLAVPAISYAGSATSRFDMTIGGAVNFNMGWVSRNQAQDATTHAQTREGSSNGTSMLAENSNWRYNLSDSNVNFTVKGPDTWGAKTMGYLRIDFRGANTGNVNGGAQLQYAFAKMDWANTYLLMGKAGAETLDIYQRNFVIAGDHSSTTGIGGIRPIQVAVRTNFAKNFTFMLGLLQHVQQDGATANNSSYGRSNYPAVMTEFGWYSDACGKVGPDMLKFAIGAIGGNEKKYSDTAAGAAGNTGHSQNLDAWMLGLRGFVPIIPEKKGNKTNALFLTGLAYIGQNNWPWVGTPAPGAASYWRGAAYSDARAHDAAAPTMYGGFVQLTYYATNSTFFNAQYGVLKNNYSQWARNVAPNAAIIDTTPGDYKGPDRANQYRVYGLSVFHDPSPSMRFALQWLRYHTNWNGFSATGRNFGTGNLENWGASDQIKAMAMYFF